MTSTHHVSGRSLHPPLPDGIETVYFAMGCFWGAERIFWEVPGVFVTAVGYAGGTVEGVTYEAVCTGETGHAEVVLVAYDPLEVPFGGLLKTFWEEHDPTQGDRQGNDVGSQYRSAIYWTTEAQRVAAEASARSYGEGLSAAGYGSITTEIAEAGPFQYAEEYHQQYLSKNPNGYCNHGFCQIKYANTDT